MHVGYSGDTPPKETIDGWNDGGMSNKRTTDMISPIASEATRSIKKTKFADTIIKSPSQKVPKSGTPGSSGLPSPGKPAVEKKGKAHPVKTGLAQRGRPPGIKTQALRLANGVNSTLKTPSTGTLEQVQQSPVLPQSSTTMTSDDRQTPKTSVDYMQESDTEATDDESSDDDQEPKIDWTKRMADINQTQTQPVQTPLTSTPLLTPSNIMSTDRLRALKVAAASATHAEKLLMETKDLAEKAQKIFTQEKQLWIEGKTRLTAENDRLKVLLDEQRLKRKKMEEGFKEKIKDAKEQKKAAEKFASEVEERMKALTLEKSAVEAELIQLRREVEMDE